MPFSPNLDSFFGHRLTSDDLERLRLIAQSGQVFEYHQSEDSFELVEGLGWEQELDPDDLDLLLYCCQLLTEEASDKIKGELGQRVSGEEEQPFFFIFEDDMDRATRNGSPVAQAFIELLKKGTDFRYKVEELPGEIRIEVIITFRSDLEYQRKKEELEWLIQVARNKAGERPFRGTKRF